LVVVSHFIWQRKPFKDNKSATTTFCYFSIGDIVCDLAIYGLWSDSARWILFREVRARLQLPSLCCDRVHLIPAGGVISLLIIIYNHFKQKYNSGQTLGIELGAMYWHFLDFLWIYLFVFYISLNKKKRKFGTLTNNFGIDSDY
jgi:cytochrome c oxidase subunit 3